MAPVVQVFPVDIEPIGDDPYVDTASRVDASVALTRPLMRSLRKMRFSPTIKKKTGKPAQQKLKSVTPVQVYPVDIEPSGDDPHVDTASRVDAAVALSRQLVRSLRKYRFSRPKKTQGSLLTGKKSKAWPLVKPLP
jgi:hypothetical protein